MLDALRNLLEGTDTSDGPVTPAQVREAIEETEDSLEEARGRLEELEDEHSDLLLTATDEEIEEHEDEIAKAERDVARLETARERLEDRLEDAKESAQLRKAAERAEEALELKQEGEKLLEEWRELTRRGVEILSRLEEIEREVENRREAFQRSPKHEYGDGTPPMRAASLGLRNPDPTDDVVLTAVEPDGPKWNAPRWKEEFDRDRPTDSTDHEQRPAGVYNEDGELVDSFTGRKRVRQPGA